jgi:hydrogenase nickel incorporation protein HypA/HybF
MHELSLAENVVHIIDEAARADGFRRVRKVTLEIGQLAMVDAEAMRFCFAAAVRGSIADGATLEIVELPGSGWCSSCAATVPLTDIIAACPRCGAFQVQASGGTEMKLSSLEVE